MNEQIAIAWYGLPAYGASLIKAGIEAYGYKIPVIATKPTIPIEGMEEILEQKVYWVDPKEKMTWSKMNLAVPKLFFYSGWILPAFNHLAKEVIRNGGKNICMIDNSWKGNLRQIVGSLVFRLVYKNRINAVWVPGKSAVKLCRFFGMPKEKIYSGLYGGDVKIFIPGIELRKRAKRFIFVAQLIKRKGVYTLAKAFDKFLKGNQGWELHVYGEGECSYLFENIANVRIRGFAQPDAIAKAMREARFLVLPSLEDNWPLAVIEAALSGCGLILSDMVRNGEDLLNDKNGMIFKTESVDDLFEKLMNAANIQNEKLSEMYDESVRIGSNYTIDQWGRTFTQIVKDHLG